MQYNDKCTIFFNLINKADYFWNFFYVSSVAIFAALIHEDCSSYNLVFKITASIIYLGFTIFNASALIRCYVFLSAMTDEIKAGAEEHFISPVLIKVLKRMEYKHRISNVLISYGIVSVINMTLLWFDKCFTINI